VADRAQAVRRPARLAEEGRESRGVGAEVARQWYNFSFVLFCSFCFVEEIEVEKRFKNGRGRVEERGERPGEVASERIGLLEQTTREWMKAQRDLGVYNPTTN
jgi:hypothetical protein